MSQPILKVCPICQTQLARSATTCVNCGYSFSTHNKVVAALLAFFLGGFGAHKFYLGSIIWGIIYFLFCWTFIPALIAFIEGIIYLCMSEERFIEKYH